MKKILGLFVTAFLVSSGVATAQSEMDAYRLSQTDINGTARYLGMSGAFGALGGDVSVINANPAGLGVFRSSEIVGSVSLNIFNSNSNWGGNKTTADKTRFNLDNFSYVGYFPTGNDEGLIGWQFGFSYNKIKNFNRSYRMIGSDFPTSLSDYIAEKAFGRSESSLGAGDNAYRNHPWLPVLGYESGMINVLPNSTDEYRSEFGEERNGQWEPYGIEYADLEVHEKGGIDQYNFAFATNISNVVFLGGSFGVTDMNYRMRTYYTEDFGLGDYLNLDNAMSIDGTGYQFNLGVIVRPSDYLRLGVAYNSPTWYKLTEYFHAVADTYNGNYDKPYLLAETPPGSYNDYRFRSPDKWIFSIAGILGQSALISLDYELINAKNARYHDVDGIEYEAENDIIRKDFKATHTIKGGVEFKVTPQFSLRAGGVWRSASMEDYLEKGLEEANVSGTIPNFTVDRGMTSFSAGFGYRFTPNFYMDMAYVFRQHKETAYAFSNAYDTIDRVHTLMVESVPADLKTNTNRIALTFGYKF